MEAPTLFRWLKVGAFPLTPRIVMALLIRMRAGQFGQRRPRAE
jgi:hypothetical protein